MSAHDQFDKMMRDLIAGKLNRRELVGGAAAAGVGAAFLGTGIASAAPNYTRAGFRSSLQDATPVAGGVLKMGMQSDPGGLDPVKLSATALWHVVEHIYNRMTTINPDLSVGLELAESLEISEDGLTYTFKLHPGVKFQWPRSGRGRRGLQLQATGRSCNRVDFGRDPRLDGGRHRS